MARSTVGMPLGQRGREHVHTDRCLPNYHNGCAGIDVFLSLRHLHCMLDDVIVGIPFSLPAHDDALDQHLLE